MTLSRRGFFFGLGATLAVIRTPGLIMPIKEIIEPVWVRVPLGRVYNFVVENNRWKEAAMRLGWINMYDDDNTEYRKVYLEHDDGFTGTMNQRLAKWDMGPLGPFQEKIAKAT